MCQAVQEMCDDARAEGLFQVIGTDFDDRYVAKLKEQSIHPEIIKDAAKDMKIVYTASRNRKCAGTPRSARAWL